jgi:formylglycine-generating enzyme required for sulfatase activity
MSKGLSLIHQMFRYCLPLLLITLVTSADTTTNSLGMKLVRIEPGTFLMGQDGPPCDYKMYAHPTDDRSADVDEKPVHRVTIGSPFQIGVTEVTIGQFHQFRPKHDLRGKDEEAVTNVTWNEATAFCNWFSKKEGKTYRLPTEAEWEYACRAGTTTVFNTGDHLPDGFQKWRFNDSRIERYFKAAKLSKEYRDWPKKAPLQVGQTAVNAWGLFDMHGNVGEWCADWYGPYKAKEQTDPLGRSDGDFRVIRSGWHSTFVRMLRSANRTAWISEAANNEVGFRVVLGELPKGELLPRAVAPLNAQNVSQSLAKIQATSPDSPFFKGPQVYVKIEPNSFGPMFSWHNHSPSITECPNGDLLAVWYSTVDEGGHELCNVASRLRLGATEWEPASPFWDGPDVNDHAPKLWWDGDKTLFHFARAWEENIVRTSTNNGATWSKPRMIQPVGEFGNDVLRLKDGTMILGNDSRQVSLVFSKDHGITWSFNDVQQRESDWRDGGNGFRYPGIHAPMVELLDGRIMAISRYDKPEDQARFHNKTPISYTSDLGKTWTFAESEFPAISSVQRQVLIRLREGPLLLCSYTDQRRDWDKRVGMTFKAADETEFKGFGLFAAISFDDGKTWPSKRLITPGGKAHEAPSIDRGMFTISDTMAESAGYLSATQTRDGNVQLISSKNHYVFNLAWLKQAPLAPKP